MIPISLQSLAGGVFRASWQASALAILIVGIQWALGRRISARVRYGLWALVLIRLAVPFDVPSPVSVHNLYSRPTPVVQRPVPVTSEAVMPMLPAVPRSLGTVPVVRSRPMPWAQWLSVAWAIGCGASALMVVVASVRLARHVRAQRPVEDGRVLDLLRSCAAEVGVRRLPRLLTGPGAGGPALVGFLRPRLLLPEAVLEFGDAELRLILLHELAHQKRWDVPANWVLAALQAAHWFNPVVHLALARVRADREMACDERVLALARADDRPAYGRTIVRLVESLSSNNTPRVPAPAVGILEGKHQLRRRITMIAEHRPVRRAWSLVALVLAAGVAAVACTDAVRGVDAPTAKQPAGTALQSSKEATVPAAGGQVVTGTLTITGGTIEDPRLSKRLPQLKFDGIPLKDALEFVRDQANLNLFIDRQQLEPAGIDLNSPVTLDLKDITVAQAFQMIGKSVISSNIMELGARVDGDVIIFGVTASPAPEPAGPPSAGAAPGGVAPADGPFGRSPSPVARSGERPVTRVYDVDSLVGGNPEKSAELTELVAQSMESTRDKNSYIGSVRMFNGKLVVSASPDLQAKAEELLDMLRQRAPLPGTNPSAVK